MIRLDNAIDTIERGLTLIPDRAEQSRLGVRIDRLDSNALRFLASVQAPLVDIDGGEPEDKKQQDSNHITRSLDQLIAVVENVDGTLRPFSREEVVSSLPTLESLKDDVVRRRALYTLYIIFSGKEPDMAIALADRLEDLTQGTILFGELALDDALLYRKIFALTVCLYSKIMPVERLAFILQDQLSLLLLFIDVELVLVMGNHIWGYIMVNTRREVSLDLASAMAINYCKLGHDAIGREMSLADWVKKIDEVMVGADGADRATEWLRTSSDVVDNTEFIQVIIRRFVLTYVALISGYFIVEYHGEGSFERLVQEVEKAYKKIPTTAPPRESGTSFPEVAKRHRRDFSSWIVREDTLQSLVDWLNTFSDKSHALAALKDLARGILSSPLGFDQATAILTVSDYLKNSGYTEVEDIVYFNQGTGVFEWKV